MLSERSKGGCDDDGEAALWVLTLDHGGPEVEVGSLQLLEEMVPWGARH